MRYRRMLFGSLAMLLSAAVSGHGLMSEPASRNWVCGVVTKPDTAEAGSACAEAFEGDFNGGYQFMSVLTHDVGRKGVSPLPTNVCGFDSETWDGGATPWDKPIDWPTQNMSPGETTITWDISWGPHFDDTEEFVYYITKPDFQYQVGEPLTWDDFESEPFCNLTGYDDTNPGATPNMNPEKGSSLFHTTCTIPERSGRHVIYGEWGRNHYTYERFHGCIDANFGGGNEPPPPTVVADMSASPSDSLFVGSGEIAFDGSGSQGSNLSYEWSVEAANDSLYSLSSSDGSSTVLSLSEPQATSEVTVRLQVSSGSSSSSTSITFTHEPEAGASWEDLGALASEANTLSEGDEVQLRLVDDSGNDTYFPANALVIDGSNGGASSWPYELAQAVNDEADGAIRVGVLGSDGDVNPAQSATDNRVYAATPSNYSSAFVEIDEAGSSSSSSSSACSQPSGSQCDWYGTLYPLCDNDDGWGWENNESCIGATTCSGQPDPYGIVGGGEDCPPTSSSSSSQESSEESSSSSEESSSSSTSSVGSGASCEHVIANDWGSGFTGSIEITNNGSSAINGWEVQWTYSGSTSVTNSWNAEVSGSNPYTATDMGWNGTIEPDETVSFGFQASGAVEQPEVTGAVCD